MDYLKTAWLVDCTNKQLIAIQTKDGSVIDTFAIPVEKAESIDSADVLVASNKQTVYVLIRTKFSSNKIFTFDVKNKLFMSKIVLSNTSYSIADGLELSNTPDHGSIYFISNPEDNTVSVLSNDQILYDGEVCMGPRKIIADGNGTIYAICDGSKNISVIIGWQCRYTSYKRIRNNETFPVDMVADNDGNIFILSDNGDIYKCHTTPLCEYNQIKMNYSVDPHPTGIHIDINGYLWVTSKYSITKIDMKSGDKTTFTSDYPVTGLDSDDEGNVIISTHSDHYYSLLKNEKELMAHQIENSCLNTTGDFTGFSTAFITEEFKAESYNLSNKIQDQLHSVIEFLDSDQELKSISSPLKNKLYVTDTAIYRYINKTFVKLNQ